ncbi:tripartite tricarboxylate transporter substrate binding protein [Paralcaligenes sp. KSB-10]|uniref:Bug family tripartite tricarboxylate transporter substrate binding protein n=1 Tax=Paralcaligenes sp. KSB-10 TaxID=2901142 RepID=UPI001E372202|nr:tripartite tricarboxylate transporter substrate binding protein [Paralcaligenes sp. KSB-10]UHL66435.1 tripartite tricarboxylate transporter substrate binding protein [Paralcaligenes sp. KSB-10]
MRKTLVQLALAAMALPLAGTASASDAWPGSKPIHLIVPYANGGSTDLVARQIGNALGKRLNQTVVVENKAGASGVIGTSYVARQPPDGYTLMIGTVSSHAIAPSVTTNLPYDVSKDFTPITTIGTIPDLIVVNPTVPANTLSDFIKLAKSRPGKISYASAGPGTSSNLGAAYFAAEAGISLNGIPYRGSGPALIDVLGGHVDMMLDVIMTSLEPLKAGKLKALAVTSKTRSPLLPNVPTVAESGLPGFEAIIWFAILAPAHMPPALQTKIADNLDAVLAAPDMKKFLLSQGIEAVGTGPVPLAQTIKADTEKWRRIAQIAHIKPQ